MSWGVVNRTHLALWHPHNRHAPPWCTHPGSPSSAGGATDGRPGREPGFRPEKKPSPGSGRQNLLPRPHPQADRSVRSLHIGTNHVATPKGRGQWSFLGLTRYPHGDGSSRPPPTRTPKAFCPPAQGWPRNEDNPGSTRRRKPTATRLRLLIRPFRADFPLRPTSPRRCPGLPWVAPLGLGPPTDTRASPTRGLHPRAPSSTPSMRPPPPCRAVHPKSQSDTLGNPVPTAPKGQPKPAQGNALRSCPTQTKPEP
jgi:hypothetical protein